MTSTDFNIEHHSKQQRFCIAISEDTSAVLEYTLLDPQTIDFTHTHVPFRHRGQGHAEALVRAGLAWANAQGFTIQASCWYVDKFLKQAPNEA